VAKDPVCGKEIDPAQVQAQSGTTMYGAPEVDPKRGTRGFHDGRWYYFCSLECRSKFLASPQVYVAKPKS
jgi:YHS domain-containing protein